LRAGAQVRRDPQDPFAARDQKPLQRPGHVPAVLERPHALAVEPTRPLQQRTEPAGPDRDRLLADQLAGPRRDRLNSTMLWHLHDLSARAGRRPIRVAHFFENSAPPGSRSSGQPGCPSLSR
jgi:hypothetical protein